jgi:thymidylate synthase
MQTIELLNVSFTMPLMGITNLDYWRQDVRPNLPWADKHFEERVCGEPINPGVEWANWPWGKNAEKFLDDRGMFDHNYMERYWPKVAGKWNKPTSYPGEVDLSQLPTHRGVRGEYGDMMDLVRLLANEPLTRQAWIPIFFPDDTGIGDGGRKPCSLGYQFIVRDRSLHIYYPLRSCDFIRHFNDDIYLTLRLGLWVIEECQKLNPEWDNIKPGSLSMHCTSLHIFRNDAL